MQCKICSSDVVKEVVSNGYVYYKCVNCNTSQILPQPSDKELTSYYQTFHLSDSEGGSYDWIEERMRADFSLKVELIKKRMNGKETRLLDVGCGKGFFVHECINAGITAQGIDVSESGIRYAVEKLKVKAECQSIENVAHTQAYNNVFDVVTLWATIEHIPDGLELLKAIKKCLKPGGVIFLDTGLGDVKEEKNLAGHSQWYDALQHLFVYSENGLKLLLENAGFEILSVDRNFERTILRKIVKWFRHKYLCYASYFFLKPILGTSGFKSMQEETKWPIDKLIQIIAVNK